MAISGPAQAEKIPFNNSYFATSWCTGYPWFPYDPGCSKINPKWPYLAWLVYVDWGFGPNDPVGRKVNLGLDIDYDPNILSFKRDQTSLLCDLRSSAATPYCPTASGGQGTLPLGVVAEEFEVDQTGLTITEKVNSAGLPRISLEYTSPQPITVAGERNFLALAFELRVPISSKATVTYSPTLLADATLATASSICTDAMGTELECSSSHPSISLKLNPAVPGPMAVAALPAMLQASRRLRRRVAQGAGA